MKQTLDSPRSSNTNRWIDFRKRSHELQIANSGSTSPLAEPYKRELLPLWQFKTAETAKQSAQKIYRMFSNYKRRRDFIGMDTARKFLQMGWSRARRYANHPSGRKFNRSGDIFVQSMSWDKSEKAKSAAVFFEYYTRVKDDPTYQRMKQHYKNNSNSNLIS